LLVNHWFKILRDGPVLKTLKLTPVNVKVEEKSKAEDSHENVPKADLEHVIIPQTSRIVYSK